MLNHSKYMKFFIKVLIARTSFNKNINDKDIFKQAIKREHFIPSFFFYHFPIIKKINNFH